MIDELKAAGLSTDEIARRAGIARGNVFRFTQGDRNALCDSSEQIVSLYLKVTGRPPPTEPVKPRGCRRDLTTGQKALAYAAARTGVPRLWPEC